MVAQVSRADTFTAFVASHEVRLRQSLMAACGGEIGSDAAAEALEYAWANWERVRDMIRSPDGRPEVTVFMDGSDGRPRRVQRG
jgi:hypothetical protein